MDAASLVAVLRALSAAGGRFDEQAACCYELGMVSPQPIGAVAEDAARTVVAALSRGVQHATLQVNGCGVLAQLAAAAPAGAWAAGPAGVAAVLGALRAHLGDAQVQGTACAALSLLNATDRATAGAAGVAAVVAAMARHPLDAAVSGHACLALGNLTLRHALGAHADGAAADAIVAALSAHCGDRKVQHNGCHALDNVFNDDRNADAVWVRRGAAAVTAITAALRAYPEDTRVLSAGCRVLGRVMQCTQDNRRAAGIGVAIAAVVAALRAFPAAAELQMNALNALAFMCRELAGSFVRDNQLAAAAAGGLEVAISALRTHATDVVMQRTVCLALGAMVGDVPPSQSRVGELGGVETLVGALRAYAVPLPAEHVHFFQRWSEVMSWLLYEQPLNKHRAVAAGVIELLVAHTCVPTGAAMLDSCCVIMAHLVVGDTGHGARAVLAGALEALEAQTGSAIINETPVCLQLIRDLQPAAQLHDAEPCAVAGCKRCAGARTRGSMCALAGCGARWRAEGGKKLLRCSICLAACYWRRHKRECSAPPRDEQAAGAASGR